MTLNVGKFNLPILITEGQIDTTSIALHVEAIG